jgi:hypothetical protein
VVAVRVGIVADGVGCQPGRAVAGDLGRLGGVLGEVPSDRRVGDFLVGGADVLHVDLVAPGDRPAVRLVGVCGRGEGDLPGGGQDGIGQVVNRDAGWWRHQGLRITRVDTVEAQDRVEVDSASALHLGHLPMRDTDRGIVRVRLVSVPIDMREIPRCRQRLERWRSMACLVRRHSSPEEKFHTTWWSWS